MYTYTELELVHRLTVNVFFVFGHIQASTPSLTVGIMLSVDVGLYGLSETMAPNKSVEILGLSRFIIISANIAINEPRKNMKKPWDW